MALDETDLAAVTKLVTDTLAASLAPLNKRFEGLPTAASIEETVKKLILAAPVTPPVDDKKLKPEENAELIEMRKKIGELTKGQETAEKLRQASEERERATAKESAIRTAMTGFEFVDENAREDCYASLDKMVQRNDQGELLANDLPVEAFVKDFVPAKKSYLLKPVSTGGSGATGSGARSKAPAFGIENIKPGMSDADSKLALSAIVAALPGSGLGK